MIKFLTEIINFFKKMVCLGTGHQYAIVESTDITGKNGDIINLFVTKKCRCCNKTITGLRNPANNCSD